MTYPLPLGANVDLTFGAAAAGLPPTAADLTFGAPAATGGVLPATMVARFALRGSVVVGYDVGVWRGLRSDTVAAHQPGAACGQHVAGAWSPPLPATALRDVPFSDAVGQPAAARATWDNPARAGQVAAAAWCAAAKQTDASVGTQWQRPVRAHVSPRAPWQAGQHVGRADSSRHGHGMPTPHSAVAPWQQGRAHQRATDARANRQGATVGARIAAPWQRALMLSTYGGGVFLPPRPTVVPAVPPVVIDMRFCAKYPVGGHPTSGLVLVFGLNPCGVIPPDSPLRILPARFYMSAHSVTAFLLPSNEPIPIFDLQLAADVSSTSWTFSATTTFTTFEGLVPTSGAPKHLRIVVDGMEWVFVVDSLSQSESFGGRKAKVAGRSQVALLGDPYQRQVARLSTVANTAQQLAADTLTPGEVGAGWSVDWGLTDWLVPAGAWSHTGTPLASIQAIAASVGGYVNAHRTDKTVLVRHPYPTLPGGIPGGPWNWEGAAGSFAADVELAPDAIISRSVERSDGADIDGVYVAGTMSGGIEALIKRGGTLGAKLAPMVTDPLITAAAAASQRGYSVLGLGGGKHKVQITMPVLTGASQPGVLDVGQLVQVNDTVPWRGRVRAVNVSFSNPTLRQQVVLERHLS